MILQGSKNDIRKVSWFSLPKDPYLILNIFFAGAILLIMVYSGIFSPSENNYPVACIHEKLTGLPCVSCGLSHSFSLILKGEISQAYEWNIYGFRVFLFFASQLVLRIVFSLYYNRNPSTGKQLIITDAIGSGIMFILTFWPFVRWIFINL